VDCQITGPVYCDGAVVTITESAVIEGDIVARDVTVFGKAKGQLIATDCVDLRSQSRVEGSIFAPKLILHEGATMNGLVDPKRVDAALSVLKFQQRKREVG
jgi:cytoskeletal protein CcmA (bactofilin family)